VGYGSYIAAPRALLMATHQLLSASSVWRQRQADAGLAGTAVQARAGGVSRASDQDRLRRRTPDEEGEYHG